MIIKRQTGGCNEFDDPPIVNIEIEDGNSLFDFSDLSSIEEQLKVWLAFS